MTEEPVLSDQAQTWDRFDFILYLYCKNTIKGRKQMTEEEKHRLDERIRREVQFLLRNAADPDFHRHINKILDYTKLISRKPAKVVLKHLRELTFFVVLDSMKKSQNKYATIGDALDKDRSYKVPWDESDNDQTEGAKTSYSYDRALAFVNEEYPELFTSRINLSDRLGTRKTADGRKTEGHRECIVETPFTQHSPPKSVPFEFLVLAAFGKDATPKFMERAGFQLNERIKISLCDPEDLSKLLMFRSDIMKLVKLFEWNPFASDPSKKPCSDDGKFDPLFSTLSSVLFAQLRLLVELRWFRSKSIEDQNKIIFKETKIEVSSERCNDCCDKMS